MDLPIQVQPSKRTDLQIKTANSTTASIPANLQLKKPTYSAPNPSQGIQQLTGQTPMPQSDSDDYYSQSQSYQQTIINDQGAKSRKQPLQIQISPKKTQQIGRIEQGQEQLQNKSQKQQNNHKESNDLSIKRNREDTLQSNNSKFDRDVGRKSDEIVFKGDDDDDAVLQEPQQFNIKRDTKMQSEWYFSDKTAVASVDVGSPFDDEEDMNSPNFNSPSPKVSNQIIPTSSIFQPSLHRRKYDLNSQGKDQQAKGFQDQGISNGNQNVMSEESKNSGRNLSEKDRTNKGNGLTTQNQQQKKSEFGFVSSAKQTESRNGVGGEDTTKDLKCQIRSKQVQIQGDQGQAQQQQGDENEEDNDNNNNSPTFFKPIYTNSQDDKNTKNLFQMNDRQQDYQNSENYNNEKVKNVNFQDNQQEFEFQEEHKDNRDGNNEGPDDNQNDQNRESNNNTFSQNNRSKSNRKQSLFRYDPSMFQSVAGYYNPSDSMQAQTIEEWQAAKTNISQGYTSAEDVEKQEIFSSLAEEYLVESQRVYIQRINRQLNGLKSAENLGDYFIRKYPGAAQLERRIAGCSQTQTYPVYIGVRGDGNCFYRGVIVSHLCYLLSLSTPLKQFETLIMDIHNSVIALIQMEYQGNVRGDSNRVRVILVQEFLVLLGQRVCISSSIESQVLMMKMFDRIATSHDFDYSLVCLARSMIYAAISRYAMQPPYCDFMLPEDIDRTKQKLCVYKEDAEYHVLSLSCEVFRHPLHILQLQKDKHGHVRFDHAITYQPQIELNHQKKMEEEEEEDQRYTIYLLLSDGHYDLVFDRTTCLDYFPSLSLFTQHAKYREDLLQFAQKCEQTQAQEQLLDVQSLLYDYTQFLKQQSGQINRMRESFVQMHSLTVKNDRSTLQQDLHLFDTIMQGMQDDIHRNQHIPGLEHIPFAQEQDDPEMSLIKRIEHSSQIGNNSKQLLSEQDQLAKGLEQKERKLSQIAEVAADQADSILPIGQYAHLQYQKSAPVSHNPSGQEQTQQQLPFREIYSMTYGTDMNPKFYYNLNSDRVYRQKAASAARLEDRRRSTDKNKIQAATKSAEQVQSFSSSSNLSGQSKAFPVCSHVSEVQITVSNIVCCKLAFCVCYPCFKTRQFLRCPCCKKELLDQTRINVTASNWKYACRRCNTQHSKETIVPLFNKLFCMNCDLQFVDKTPQ